MQDNNLPSSSYVNDYQPPQPASPPSNMAMPFNPPGLSGVSSPAPAEPAAPVSAPASHTTPWVQQTTTDSQVDVDSPTVSESETQASLEAPEPTLSLEAPEETSSLPSAVDSTPAAPVAPAAADSSNSEPIPGDPSVADQSLESQNIFDLLGVSDGKEDEKEAFLDELQEVIWEDFLDNDVTLILKDDELKKVQEMKAKGKTLEVQEELLVYLEKLIPDLEEIMMDKALELKEDMVLERIAGMREFHSSNQEALSKINEAEKLIAAQKWADAAALLNQIK